MNAPSQKPQLIVIQADGGCVPNPGNKYASYLISLNGSEVSRKSRFPLGHGTNNEAEFQAISTALIDCISFLNSAGLYPSSFNVIILTDSKIAANRISKAGHYKKHRLTSQDAHARMSSLTNNVLSLLANFNSFSVSWLPRASNVLTFGH